MVEQLRITSDVAKLHSLFGKSMYSSKYAWISEICQNAVDSHRMARVVEPVVIGIKYDEKDKNMQTFYVKDIGLSFTDPEDFKKKIGSIGDSGKVAVKTDDEFCPMGKHGIGSLSVSIYQPEWQYTVVTPTQEKFRIIMREIPGKGMTMETIEMGKTEEEKSVLFEVKVLYNGTPELIKNMKVKLAYFKDIMFDFPEALVRGYKELLTLNTEFQIFQSDDFQISTMSAEPDIHVCLDQYSYPITNWQELGLARIPMNIGLRFTMADGLSADSTRENLQMDEKYAPLIKAKIKKVANWFVERYNNEMPEEYTSLKDMLLKKQGPKFVIINDVPYDIKDLARISDVKMREPVFKGVKEGIFTHFVAQTNAGKDLFPHVYEITMSGAKKSKVSRWKNFDGHKILVDKPIAPRLMDYIKEKHRGWVLCYNKPIKLFKKSDLSTRVTYQEMFGLEKRTLKQYHKTGTSPWREVVDQCKLLIQAAAKDYHILASEIKVPADFNKKPAKVVIRKEKVDVDNLSGEVGIKYAVSSRYSADFHCKFEEKVVKVRDLAALPILHVYAAESERARLDFLYTMYEASQMKIVACIIGVKQQPHIQRLKLSNFMKLEDYLTGKHESFRGMMTSYIIETELRQPFKNIFDSIETVKKYISPEFAKDMGEVNTYCTKYATQYKHPEKDQLKVLMDLTHDLKLYDNPMWEKFQRMKKVIGNLDYAHYLGTQVQAYNSKIENKSVVNIIHDVTRHRATTMEWEGYELITKS